MLVGGAQCWLRRGVGREHEHSRPFSFSNKSRTSLCGRVSKTQPAWGSTRATCQWGRGRQAMHLPCKQVDVGALPTDSTNFNCGENEIQVSLISFASVGATPTPATIHGK